MANFSSQSAERQDTYTTIHSGASNEMKELGSLFLELKNTNNPEVAKKFIDKLRSSRFAGAPTVDRIIASYDRLPSGTFGTCLLQINVTAGIQQLFSNEPF